MLFRNPFKNSLDVIYMGVSVVSAAALAVIALCNTRQWLPLMIFCLFLGNVGAMFIADKRLKVLCAIVLVLCIIGIAFHDLSIGGRFV